MQDKKKLQNRCSTFDDFEAKNNKKNAKKA